MVSSTSSWSPMSYSSTTKNDECALPSDTRDNFSRYSKFLVKNFNIIYEGQYQRRRIQQVALSPTHQQPHHMPPSLSTTSSPHPHPWPKLLKRIVEILSHANPDVICLQECELQSFKYDLAPALSKFGYDGISQEDDRPKEDMPTSIKAESKHRDARNPIVATFWKRDKFECIGTRNWQAQCVSVGRRLQLRAPILRMLHLPPHAKTPPSSLLPYWKLPRPPR